MLDNFLPFQNAFNADVYNRINGDIGLANLNDDEVASKLTHGVEKIIKNPLWATKRIRPTGIVAIRTDGYPVAGSVDWRNISPDQIGVTVRFLPPESGSGSQGEYLESFVPFASRINLTTTATNYNITSLSLTPGTYDLTAMGQFGGTITGTQTLLGISTSATPTMPGASAIGQNREETPTVPTAVSGVGLVIVQYRVTPTTNTIYYLVGQMTFTGGSPQAWGRLSAVRAAPYLNGYQANVALRIMGG